MCIDSNYYKQPLWVKILELQKKGPEELEE